MTEPGFHFSPDGLIHFKAIKEYKVNTDWSLSLDDVAGIAICNTMYGDWDSDFLVIFRKKGDPIHHAIGGFIGFSEEKVGLDQFWQLLVDRFQVPLKYSAAFFKLDTTVLIYPKGHETESVYFKWYESWAAFKFMLKRALTYTHTASGLLRSEMIELMGLGRV